MGDYVDWIKIIAQAQANKCGPIGLSRLLMEKIGRTVFVTDKRGRVLAWQVSPGNLIPPEEKVYIPYSVLKSSDKIKGIITLNGQKFSYYCWPISDKKIWGYLWVLMGEETLSPEELNSVECINSAMLVELVRNQEQDELKQHLRDEFIRNILFNNVDNIFAIGQNWGWDLSLDHVVIILEGVMRGYGRGLYEVRGWIEDILNTKYPGVVCGMLGDSFVILLPLKHQLSENSFGTARWKDIAHKAFAQLQKELVEFELWGGVGIVHWNTPSLYRSYQEAKVALQLGKYAGSKGNLTFFDELGAIRLFYNQREQDLREYFEEILGPIRQYDDQNEGNLLLTLWTYYVSGGKVADTIAKLHIHANTLRYRLHKVEELLGAKLDDQEVGFNVYAALKVGIMIDLKWRE